MTVDLSADDLDLIFSGLGKLVERYQSAHYHAVRTRNTISAKYSHEKLASIMELSHKLKEQREQCNQSSIPCHIPS